VRISGGIYVVSPLNENYVPRFTPTGKRIVESVSGLRRNGVREGID